MILNARYGSEEIENKNKKSVFQMQNKEKFFEFLSDIKARFENVKRIPELEKNFSLHQFGGKRKILTTTVLHPTLYITDFCLPQIYRNYDFVLINTGKNIYHYRTDFERVLYKINNKYTFARNLYGNFKIECELSKSLFVLVEDIIMDFYLFDEAFIFPAESKKPEDISFLSSEKFLEIINKIGLDTLREHFDKQGLTNYQTVSYLTEIEPEVNKYIRYTILRKDNFNFYSGNFFIKMDFYESKFATIDHFI